MKIVYSHLQKFLPGLNVEPHRLRDDLTLIGHFTNYFEKIGQELVFDLDIKVNRGDCHGYYGLARDLSVYYHLPLNLPEYQILNPPSQPLSINVSAISEVVRIQAVKLTGIKNSPSPAWLKTFVEAHQIHSVNTIVDLTNLAMFYWGIPNHAFDTAKSGDSLIWELNTQYSQFTTLDGTTLKLKPKILMVNSPTQALSLSFLGGSACAIELGTTEIILEMAVYDRSTVKSDSRFLKTVTEAGIRLDKDLDPNLIPQAFNHLVNIILQNCGGQLASEIYDYYPNPTTAPSIPFDPTKPASYAGIDIPSTFATQCLTDLGCQVNNVVTPPSLRPDLLQEADLIEEVIRFWGYDKIPTDSPISSQPFPSITPPLVSLQNFIKKELVKLGYDEVISWPLTNTPSNPSTVITTQNSINSEYPYLRQNLTTSLLSQLDSYERYKLPQPQFFEIGPVFNLTDGTYQETTHLGLYHHQASTLKLTLSRIQELLKINSLPLLPSPSPHIIEIDLSKLVGTVAASIFSAPLSAPTLSNSIVELTNQILSLDANVTLTSPQIASDLLNTYLSLIPSQHLWSLSIIDQYQNAKTNTYRYTFRVHYFNCDDKTAKAIHLKAFNLA